MGGILLAFTQEDFLVLCQLSNKTLIQSNLEICCDTFICYTWSGMEGACKEHTSLTDKQTLTSLVAAAELDPIRCIEKLLKAGADVNAVDGNGYSALIRATENNFKDIVSILLQAGADVNLVNNYGDTALIQATENDYDECLKLLIDGGADVNVTDSDSDAAVSLAVYIVWP